ncbi:aspartyl/asparaginyl beta-hydroxylase domain-containing protein [Amycolatopsis sp. lyj-23]|uniref:aspartyl/asparaginyl beta-hydroxylase domain-containing protein n=1 Tax=Amycolatopsis sp. lyj-23 TaxID=2789283 RepID=UPI00397E302E
MRSHLVGTIQLDHDKVADELDASRRLEFHEPYEEFICGRTTAGEGQLMLYTPGGEVGDGIIANYDPDAPPGFTEHGRRLPYVASLMEQALAMEHVRFARVVCMKSNVLVPHRDYVEFESVSTESRPMHRLHIPLITNEHCMFSDNNTVYRMKAGEVWFLDATQVHTAAALTTLPRMHLIVDFADVPDRADLLRIDLAPTQEIPERSLVTRPPLSEAERAALHGLAWLVTETSILDMFGIIAKTHFRRDGGEDFFWNTVANIRDRLTDSGLAAHLDNLHSYYVQSRGK